MSDDLIAEALTEHWGPRCKAKDTDDFPELAGATQGRCACCLAWEQYDGLRAEVERLTAALADELAHADALAEAVEMFATDRNWLQGGPFDPCSPSFTGTSMASAVAKQHRARRQG